MVAKRTQGGYVALMAVLIIGAVATAIGLTLLSTGTDSVRLGLTEQQSKQARALALACAEEAMQQIHDNVAFTATNTSVSLGQGSCTYSVGVSGTTLRTVSATGTVGAVIRKIQASVTVGASTITAPNWKDVDDRYSTVSYVQGANYTSDSGSASLVQAFPTNVTAGNFIVAAASWDSATTTVMSCSDNRGNSYTVVNVWNYVGDGQTLAICYAPNVAAGATTVTAALGGGAAFRRMVISEYSGVATSNPVDVYTGVTGSSSVTTTDGVTSGSVTTTLNGDLIFGAVMDTTGSTGITPGTGFLGRGYANTKDLVVEDKQLPTAGSAAATFTFSTASQRYNAAIVAFKAARQ